MSFEQLTTKLYLVLEIGTVTKINFVKSMYSECDAAQTKRISEKPSWC